MAEKGPMARMQVLLPPELKAEIERFAEEQGLSANEAIRVLSRRGLSTTTTRCARFAVCSTRSPASRPSPGPTHSKINPRTEENDVGDRRASRRGRNLYR